MLLPVVILVMYLQAQKVLDAREACGIVTPSPDDVYAHEPRSTLVRLIVGIALFSFVLGVSRGFPFGESIKLSPSFQLVQHVGVTVAALGVMWWALVKGRRLRFSVLWQAQLAALAVGVIMLSTLDPFTGQIGATLIAVTNLFQVGFLWFTSYDVARHRALPPYLVVGFFWFLHLFFRESHVGDRKPRRIRADAGDCGDDLPACYERGFPADGCHSADKAAVCGGLLGWGSSVHSGGVPRILCACKRGRARSRRIGSLDAGARAVRLDQA